jgi:hypothetical protein
MAFAPRLRSRLQFPTIRSTSHAGGSVHNGIEYASSYAAFSSNSHCLIEPCLIGRLCAQVS